MVRRIVDVDSAISDVEFRLTIPNAIRVEVKESSTGVKGKPPITIMAVHLTGGKTLSFALLAADVERYGPVRVFKVTELSDSGDLGNR